MTKEPDQEPIKSRSLEEFSEALERAKAKHLGDDSSGKAPSMGSMRVGVELLAGVVVGTFSGYYLDRWLGTSPVFFLVCFFLGVAGSAINIYKVARRVTDQDE